MKSKLILLGIFFIFSCQNSSAAIETDKLQTGDIIFQVSQSDQSTAIQIATNSRYSHVGILYQKGDTWYVLEAVQPVKLTPLKTWIERGKDKHYVVKRLKDSDAILTKEKLERLRNIEDSFLGKKYDIYFNWSDEELYCSELVYKVYQRATGVEIGKLQKLRDFNLRHPVVAKKLRERYGNNIPLEEKVISPASIFQSKKLETVTEN